MSRIYCWNAQKKKCRLVYNYIDKHLFYTFYLCNYKEYENGKNKIRLC